MLTPAAIRARLRAVLDGPRCIAPACVFDPVSARLAEDIGFEAVLLAGSVAAATMLGAPDDVTITLTELAEHVRRICRVSNLPLIVDADHGYGNARNAARTVSELEHAGAAAILLEDTVLPAPFGANAAQLIAVEEGAAKLRAAIAARADPNFLIIARSIALGVDGLDDAVMRAQAYEAAGADALFFGRLQTRAQLDRIRSATSIPLVLGKLTAELSDLAYLGAQRVRIAVPGHEPFLAAVQAVDAALRAVRAGAAPDGLAGSRAEELLEHVLESSQR